MFLTSFFNTEETAAISPGYWELFVDLLLVAAASSMADTLLEHQTLSGLFEFFLLYMAIIHSWLLYTHHYTSRFKEASLVHTLILLVYMFGMAVTIVNASFRTAAAFSIGIVIQRVAYLVMLVPIGFQIPRAYPFVVVLGLVTTASLLPHLLVIVHPKWVKFGWFLAAMIDFSTDAAMLLFLPGPKLIPINIEHTKDRLGVLVRTNL
jgi:low temperature requirement protein LtrA